MRIHRGIKRAFRKDFCKHMESEDGWPSEDAFQLTMTQRGEQWFKNGAYGLARKGKYQPLRLTEEVIKYLRQESTLPELLRKRTVLHNYLKAKGVPDPERLEVKDILGIACRPIRRKPVVEIVGDAFRGGLTQIRDMFRFRPWTYVQLLRKDEADLVRESIYWMYVDVGRATAGATLRPDFAVKQGEARIGIPLEQYQEYALAWWNEEPWTVVRAWWQRKAVGMCIALPVRPEVYAAVRAGEKRSYHCTPADFCNPSTQLLTEAAAMLPYEAGSEYRKATRSLLFAMTCQQAYLTTAPGLFTEQPMRLLAPAGTKQNERRARWVGYKRTGTFFKDSKIPMLEFSYRYDPPSWRHPIGTPAIGTWCQLQYDLRTEDAQKCVWSRGDARN